MGERELVLVYKRVIGLTADQAIHIREACILTPEDLMMQAKDSLVRLCEQKNNIIPAGRVQRLLALKYWMIDNKKPGHPIPVSAFTDEVMEAEQFKLVSDELANLRLARGQAPQKPSSNGPPKDNNMRRNAVYPKHFNGDRKEFQAWRIQVEGYVGSHSLEYVIKHSYSRYGSIPDLKTVTIDDAYEPSETVKATATYKTDNNFIFQQLKSLCSMGNAYQLIRQFEDDCDGRNAWITLCQFYESAALPVVPRSRRITSSCYRSTRAKRAVSRLQTTCLATLVPLRRWNA
jgi:hypothetical protein